MFFPLQKYQRLFCVFSTQIFNELLERKWIFAFRRWQWNANEQKHRIFSSREGSQHLIDHLFADSLHDLYYRVLADCARCRAKIMYRIALFSEGDIGRKNDQIRCKLQLCLHLLIIEFFWSNCLSIGLFDLLKIVADRTSYLFG